MRNGFARLSVHDRGVRLESVCPAHSSIPKSETSVLLDLPIKFARKLDGSTDGDVHERERC